ncbi:MAG TPA: NAD+ synthase [Solirubrobacterales bacterium]|nr:NAD+ synthase [Solirubrobacterales bacterium]
MDEPRTALRIALAQVNPTVGDVDGNAALAAEWISRAREGGADIVLLPELVISGYPPEDLLLKPHFLAACEDAVEALAQQVDGIVAMIGCPVRDAALHNGLAVVAGGRVVTRYRKVHLPNYGVFDERRYFEPGPVGELIAVDGALIGLTICEDIWLPGPPGSEEAAAGARLLVNASASPYHRFKGVERERMVAERARAAGTAIALCNAVGGQDELVFDGHSFVVDAAGRTLARAAQFEQELLLCDVELPVGEPAPAAAVPLAVSLTTKGEAREPLPVRISAVKEPVEEVYAALVTGLGDYAAKNGFDHAVLGLSGGIDSALVALIAADALGGERLTCVVMPSPHSSPETQADARTIAANLGAETLELPIASVMEAYEDLLAARFAGCEPGITEENLQARTRGNLVMALSNKFGWLALSTGNKSEMSVGYATLYGDMAGGFAVLKDVPKLLVYELTRDRMARADRELIPTSVIDRAPSAELRPDQQDTDSLPPYEILDPALALYIEGDGSREDLVESGLDRAEAQRVAGLVDRAEYKRRQAPPGVKITAKAFGRDRRLPITNAFRG